MTSSVPLAYLNGRFLPQSEASLPLHDAGFVMGATVTDFCRTFNHVLFRWPDHLVRFRRDCGECFIPLPTIDDELTSIAAELIAKNGPLLTPGQELALITFATPGPVGYYLGESGGAGDGPTTLGMHTFPLPFERYRRFFAEGVSLAVPIQHVHNPAGLIDQQIKHRSRLHWWILDRDLRSKPETSPGTLALLYDAQTHSVTETAIGNVLIVERGTVLTPWRDTILDGISLRVVEELCESLQIPFGEGSIDLDTLRTADEAMLSGTAFSLAGVSRIDDHAIPWPGPVFTHLLNAWSERVGVDIARQFLPNP
jgi:branched-chain amino acid aminotransferase